jgi:hypothetical protein
MTAALAGHATAPAARACSCMPPGPVVCDLGASTAVFRGTVVDVAPVSSGPLTLRVTLQVERVWKGPPTEHIQVLTGDSRAGCGFPFVFAEDYIVYADRFEGGALVASICSRTRRFDPVEAAALDAASGGGANCIAHLPFGTRAGR